ncbi:MAG TPA: galactose-1-phosphate uridylyltransferase [Gemmataceae bacterium]|nr:galactose-1-phosphate uridylyltransferase [Gemmataceae bacterium]
MNHPVVPQLRKDPIVDRWVLIAPERAERPTELEEPAHLAHHETCPFCEGRERETTPEVLAFRAPGSQPDGPGWKLRVVANRYPAVRGDAGGTPCTDKLFASHPGVGAHEVVVECPQHEASLAALPPDQFRLVFTAYRDRLKSLRDDERIAYAQVFKNHGVAAGASVEHAHSQILALSQAPHELRNEYDAAERYHRTHGRCVFCDLLGRERDAGVRMVSETEHVAAFAAFAGRFPYETWLLPIRHAGHYDRLSDAELTDAASVVRTILRRLGDLNEDAAYNYVLHTLPLRVAESPAYHWHLEILPRLTGIAGFELATGCFANPVPPEEAAARLRAGI